MRIKKNQLTWKILSLFVTIIGLAGISKSAEAVTCVCTFKVLGFPKDVTLSTNKSCAALNEAKISVDGHPASNCREVPTTASSK